MKFKDLVKMTLIMALLLYGVIFFFERKMDKMQEDFNKQNKKIDNEFKILSDGVSARSEVQVVAQPGLFDKIFNTALNKQYKEIQKIKANYLFVGDDWYKDKKWKHMELKLKKINCKVIYFPYTKGTSSTLINNILIKNRK